MTLKLNQLLPADPSVIIYDTFPEERAPSWRGSALLTPGSPLSLPALNLASCSREQTLDYFSNGWALNELLFSSLQSESAFTRAPDHELRHPLIFYYGHTATLFANKLRVAGLIPTPINEDFERLFEVGVDEMSWDDLSKNTAVWPAVKEVSAYRQRVFEVVKALILSHPGLAPGHAPITQKSPLWALFMSMEHDRIHLETSSVLIRETPLEFLKRPLAWPSAALSAAATPQGALPSDFEPIFAPCEGGLAALGKPADSPSYGWDNEYGARDASAAPFEFTRHLITNAQYLRFVHADGYSTERYWSDEGWRWRAFRNTKHPAFWVEQGPSGLRKYAIRTLFEIIDWAGDWPVCVNAHEARAYLAWKSEVDQRSYRLPTEAEHALLRRAGATSARRDDEISALSAQEARDSRKANINLAFGSEVSTQWAMSAGSGASDAAGNVWEWCEDDFHPLTGFEAHSYYEDFSSPCFDGRHQMMLGGSFTSTGAEASAFARFHFRPHFHQHSGFRMVVSPQGESSAIKINKGEAKYDQQKVLDQYLLFHYGEATVAAPRQLADAGAHEFPQRVARKLLAAAARLNAPMDRALDVGCAVGGSSFALAQRCSEVIGVDLSSPFINAAKALQRKESVPYRIAMEGAISQAAVARAPTDSAIADGSIAFRVEDACALPQDYQGFNLVLASNLLCRLPDPGAFLARMGGALGLVKPGGLVAFASPLSWLEQFTPKEKWLGGSESSLDSFEGLKKALGPEFELVDRSDEPFVIREHQRKFEYVISDLTLWRRRS